MRSPQPLVSLSVPLYEAVPWGLLLYYQTAKHVRIQDQNLSTTWPHFPGLSWWKRNWIAWQHYTLGFFYGFFSLIIRSDSRVFISRISTLYSMYWPLARNDAGDTGKLGSLVHENVPRGLMRLSPDAALADNFSRQAHNSGYWLLEKRYYDKHKNAHFNSCHFFNTGKLVNSKSHVITACCAEQPRQSILAENHLLDFVAGRGLSSHLIAFVTNTSATSVWSQAELSRSVRVVTA